MMPSYELHKTIRMLPGYNPFAQAGECVFDEELAKFAIDFVQECCRHVKGPLGGQLIVLEGWQKALFANLWGWRRPDGMRRYREALVYIPRGNGKTAIAATLVNLVLFTEHEPGAELYSSAAERDQARLCFETVAGMIRQEPELENRAQIYKHSVLVGDRTYKALSAEAGSKHGFNVHLLVNDELHAQKTPELTEVLMTGMGKRTQPLAVHLTTADYEREGSICNAKHDYACKVRDGVIEDPSFLPVIYEATREDDWTSPEVWAKANPNLGVSVPLDYLERECKRAQSDPAYENTFKRLHLNIRTEQAFRLIQMAKWDACDKPVEFPAGCRVVGALDLASVEDMASLVLCRVDGEGDYHFMPHYWCPESKVRELEQRGDPTYRLWVNQGLLTATPGSSTDFRAIRKTVNEFASEFDLAEVNFDPWNARHIATELAEEDGVNMLEHRQGTVAMNEPTKKVISLMLDGKIRHGGHPILRWNMSNLAGKNDPSGNIRPDKAASSGKIDGAVCVIMAAGRAEAVPPPGKSFYEDNGMEFA